MAATVVAQQTPQLYEALSSPDGMWEAQVLVYDCVALDGGEFAPDEYAYEVVRLRATDGESIQVDEQLLRCGGLGAAGFDLILWSPDGRYLYYTPAREGVPDGCGFWVPPLVRFDRQTHMREPIGTAIFSPDGQRMAVLEGSALSIWNIDDGEKARWGFPQEGVLSGVAWSPGNDRVALLFLQQLCPHGAPARIYVFDVLQGVGQLVLETDEHVFVDIVWQEDEYLRLIDDQGAIWGYSFETGELQREGKEEAG